MCFPVTPSRFYSGHAQALGAAQTWVLVLPNKRVISSFSFLFRTCRVTPQAPSLCPRFVPRAQLIFCHGMWRRFWRITLTNPSISSCIPIKARSRMRMLLVLVPSHEDFEQGCSAFADACRFRRSFISSGILANLQRGQCGRRFQGRRHTNDSQQQG